MSNVNMKGYRVSELHFVANVENGKRIELGNKFSYNVNYSANNTCKAEFSIEVSDKEAPDKFRIKAVCIGIFEYKAGTKKEQVHIETYKELFPYARALITTVTANAGIPPIIIPGIDIESQSIYKFERNMQRPPEND